MKNCDVAELGSPVRAMASVPGTFIMPALLDCSDSIAIGGFVGFCLKSGVKPPPWIMKPENHAVELRAVVVLGFDVIEKVGDGLGRGIRKELDLDLAGGGVELDLGIGGERRQRRRP